MDWTADGQWPDPIPLPGLGAPKPFPTWALPGWAGAYVTALARATQTPPDLAGCSVLGVLSACAGGRVVIEARPGWLEPVNIYTLPVLPSASRKSAVVADVTAPLYELQRELAADIEPQVAERAAERDLAQKTAEEAARKAAKADPADRDELAREALKLAAAARDVVVPRPPRLIADDATPEAAATLLAQNDGRIAFISAEGGVWDMAAGRYSSSGVVSLDIWLKGHSGDPLTIDRKAGPSEHIPRPAITCLLTVQPVVLRAISRNDWFRGRGLLGRWLYSVPASNIGHRLVGEPPVPDRVREAYTDHVRELAKGLRGEGDPHLLRLTAGAQRLFQDYERLIEVELREGGDLSAITDWAGKLAGATLRIAALLHLGEHGSAGLQLEVTRGTAKKAIRFGRYFADHARRAFDLLGDSGAADDARYVLAFLLRRKWTSFSLRQLLTELPRGRFDSAETVELAVSRLEEHHCVRLEEPEERKGRGRPPSPRYTVNPSAESAQYAEMPSEPNIADCADIADGFSVLDDDEPDPALCSVCGLPADPTLVGEPHPGCEP